MNKNMTVLSIALLGMVTALPVAADGDRRHERNYEDRIAQRIEHGRETGELTRYERKELRRDQREISRLERRFLRDDHLNRKERRILRAKRAELSNRIYDLKHNDRYRDRARHYRGRHHRDRYASNFDDGWWLSLGFIDH